MDGERMHAALKFVRQRRVDHAMAFEPALPAEGLRYNIKPEMSFPAGPMSGMAFMQMRFVLDMDALRRKGREQSCRDDVLHAHDPYPCPAALAMRQRQGQQGRRAVLPSVKS